MSESVGPVTVTSSIDGAEFEFRSMVGSEEVSQPFHYELEVLSPSAKHGPDKMLGSSFTVHLTRRDNVIRHFHGYVTAFALRGNIGAMALYSVTVRPWLALLGHRTNCRIFKGTAIDIAKEVFADYEGLQSAKFDGPEKLPTYEFVIQYRESDLNFVMRILERDGLYFYFEHETNLHTMVVTDDGRLTVPGFEVIRWHPPDSNSEQIKEGIDDWRPHYAFTAGKWGTTDFDFKAANVDLEVRAIRPPKQIVSEIEAFDFPGGYIEAATGDALASRRLATLQVASGRYEGQTNARGITAGQLFKMESNSQIDLNVQYFVYSVHFQILSHANTSESAISAHGDVMRASVVALAADRPFHPMQRTPRPSMTGIQTATVVGEKPDVELDPDNFGRVKIRFHWDRATVEGAPTTKETTGKNSCWVRVSQLWAGPSFGAVFHPRLGQEVLVDFIEGDPDQPIIVGRVHNSLNVPPYTSTTQSGIRTHSIPGGSLQNYNEIRFEDKMGSEELYIQAEKTQTTKVKGSQSVSVGGSRSVSVTGPETYTVGKTRNVTVTNAVTETYNETHTVNVTASQKMTAADQTFTAKGGITLIQSEATQESLKDGNVSVIAANSIQLACTSTKIFLDTAFMNLDAKTKIQLKVGSTVVEIEGSSVKITSTGTVDVSGATINLNSAG